MALQTPTSYAGWVHLAEARLVNILEVRIAANIRQLEAKISESGPADKRPQPHIVQVALKNLIGQGQVKILYAKREAKGPDTRFYPRPALPRARAQASCPAYGSLSRLPHAREH